MTASIPWSHTPTGCTTIFAPRCILRPRMSCRSMMPSASTPAWGPSSACGMRGKSPLSTASAIRTRIARTSGRWISGTRLSLTKSAKRAGWAAPYAPLIPKGTTVSGGVNWGGGLRGARGGGGGRFPSGGNSEPLALSPAPQDERARQFALETFTRMYGGAAGRDVVKGFLGQTASDALKGADILRTAPAQYTSTVAYADNAIAQNLKSMAQVLCADLSTRIYYTQHA